MKKLLVFDNDGVLRDESVSYTRCIRETVAFFADGKGATEEELIESMKKSNDDWERTHQILMRRGIEKDFSEVQSHFQDLYLGKKRDYTGYINDEPWLADNKLLSKLVEENVLVIVSGAPKDEIEYTLKRNNAFQYFSLILGMHECKNKKDGIVLASKKFNLQKIFFCDDRPSPIRQTINSGYKVYGIMPPKANEEWKTVLKEAGAVKVFDNVNDYCKYLLSLQ